MRVRTAVGGFVVGLSITIGSIGSGLGGQAVPPGAKGGDATALTRALVEIRLLSELVIQVTADRNLLLARIAAMERNAPAMILRREGINGQMTILRALSPGDRIALHDICVVYQSYEVVSSGLALNLIWTWPGDPAARKQTILTGDLNEFTVTFNCV